MSKKMLITTFGCQMNVHDSERMAGLLKAVGYERTSDEVEADVLVLNTCSVREKADQKFQSELGRLRGLKAEHPGKTIVVAGCVAEQAGDKLRSRFPHIDVIVGTSKLEHLAELIEAKGKTRTAIGEDASYHRRQFPAERSSWPRAWVSIMYGCDNFCTYCIVPFARGRERSRSVIDIVHEISGLAKEGYREIILLGQNVNSYGKGTDLSFPELLEAVHGVAGIERIRFVTSHPKDLSPRLVETFSRLPKLCPHLHLPLQSGSDGILRAMNRRYTWDHYRGIVSALRKAVPDLGLTTDMIVGFPGETDEEFEASMAAVEEIRYDGIFAFKYSPRPHTRAASLEDSVPSELKQARLVRLLAAQDRITLERNRQLEGRTMEVLVEYAVEAQGNGEGARLTGRTGTNKLVHFDGPARLKGFLVSVVIERALMHSLQGSLVRTERDADLLTGLPVQA